MACLRSGGQGSATGHEKQFDHLVRVTLAQPSNQSSKTASENIATLKASKD